MYLENKVIQLSTEPRENIISHDGKYYRVDFLKEKGKYIQGGNGVIFSLINEEEGKEYAIKFVKFPEQLKQNSKANQISLEHIAILHDKKKQDQHSLLTLIWYF